MQIHYLANAAARCNLKRTACVLRRLTRSGLCINDLNVDRGLAHPGVGDVARKGLGVIRWVHGLLSSCTSAFAYEYWLLGRLSLSSCHKQSFSCWRCRNQRKLVRQKAQNKMIVSMMLAISPPLDTAVGNRPFILLGSLTFSDGQRRVNSTYNCASV